MSAIRPLRRPAASLEPVSAEILDALEIAGGAEPLRSWPSAAGSQAPALLSENAGARSRLWRWVLEHRLSLAIVVVLCVATGVVQAVGLSGWPARYDDEGTYVAQAWAVTHLGELAPYTYWYDHPPIGWILLALIQVPLSLVVHSVNAITAGRIAMLAVDAVSSGLVYALARRVGMRRGFAVLALLIFALNPLALNYHRMVFLDNLAVPWLLAAFVFALSPRRSLWDMGASGICFALALLSKETMLLTAPGLLVAVWQGSDRATRRYSLTVFAASLTLAVAFYPLMAIVKGELFAGPHHVSLLNGISFQLFTRQSSGSAFQAGTLTHKYLEEWLYLDRYLPYLSLALVIPALALRRLRAPAVTLAIGFFGVLRPGYMPAMYLIAYLPFACLVVAGVFDAVWSWHPTRRRLPRWIGPAVAAICLGTIGAFAVPAWARSDHKEMTFDSDKPVQQAEKWIYAHVNRKATLLTDDTLWLDLVEHGFQRNRVVWYYKLGTDSEVDARFPSGWRDFDYVVSSDVMRSGSTPEALAAIKHSRTVASFGTGTRRIEIKGIVR